MAVQNSGTVDANIEGSEVAEIAITTERLVTLYVEGVSGSHQNHVVCVDFSPDDGDTWFGDPHVVIGGGFISINIAATAAKARVAVAEGEASNIQVYLAAK